MPAPAALEPFGQLAVCLVTIAMVVEFFNRGQHVIAAGSGAAVALPDIVQLLGDRESPGILPVAAVYHVAKSVHRLLRIVIEPDCAPRLAINQGDLLARPQIADRSFPFARCHPVGDAAAIAAAVEAQHQPGLFRRTAVMEGIDAEGPMRPDRAGVAPFQKIETRPPHYA